MLLENFGDIPNQFENFRRVYLQNEPELITEEILPKQEANCKKNFHETINTANKECPLRHVT